MSASDEEIIELREDLGKKEQEVEELTNENEYLRNIQDHYDAGNDGELKHTTSNNATTSNTYELPTYKMRSHV